MKKYVKTSRDSFTEELKNFIEENKGKKFQNSDVDPALYQKLVDRRNAGSKTNVKAVKDVYKLYQYYLISQMLGSYRIQTDCEHVISDTLSYKAWMDFRDMFSEIEKEMPDYRVLKNPSIVFEDGKYYVMDRDGQEYEAIPQESEVTYMLLPDKPELNPNCWKKFEYKKKAAPGSIDSIYPWKIWGKVTFDKNLNEYHISDIAFILDLSAITNNVNYLCFVARYTGLHNSAWITEASIDGGYGAVANSEWTKKHHQTITRGYIYLYKAGYNYELLSKIRGDWDGFYNNISFEKLKKLLESAK